MYGWTKTALAVAVTLATVSWTSPAQAQRFSPNSMYTNTRGWFYDHFDTGSSAYRDWLYFRPRFDAASTA